MNPTLDHLRGHRLRLNPNYRLVEYSELPESLIQAYDFLLEEQDFFGLLVPVQGSGLTYRSASGGDAFLFSILQEGRMIPGYFPRIKKDCRNYLLQLLGDRVLEIELAKDEWASGPCALGSEIQQSQEPSRSLSDRALRYAAELRGLDTLSLSGRLYFYNRLPCTLALRSRFPTQGTVKQWLLQGKEISHEWDERVITRNCWLYWTSRSANRQRGGPTFKLYFSILPNDLPNIFHECAMAAADSGAFALKIAGDAFSLCRPDKFVAYFEERTKLDKCVELLSNTFDGIGIHAIPFTTPTGVEHLSWGIDPPQSTPLPWVGGESWRTWVSRKLASAVSVAQADDLSIEEIVTFAKSRLTLEGIDTRTWMAQVAE